MISKDDLEQARKTVYAAMPPTPQYAWPLLRKRTGVEVWIKHENHTPTGAFKVRGGLVLLAKLAGEGLKGGIISATRGNHGQSLPFAAGRYDIATTIVVPEGNSLEKNAAMQALGAELVEYGADFNVALDHAIALAEERGLTMIGSFLPQLVAGVSTYAAELMNAVDDLDTIYVPIGMGSGVCANIAVRDLLGLKTRIVGVVSANANAYALSFKAGKPVATNSADTLADGMAVRIPHPEAVEIINKGVERVVEVSDDEIATAMRVLYSDTHNMAEGAGAAALAALMQERDRLQGKKAAAILTGGNIDMPLYQKVLSGALWARGVQHPGLFNAVKGVFSKARLSAGADINERPG